ncbi:MAG: hypothetical protein ACXWBQ_04315 [Usitatibacter sp.]
MRSILRLAFISLSLAVGSAHAATFFQYISQPGDYVGQGSASTFTAADTTFSSDGNESSFTVRGNTTGFTRFWDITLQGPAGQQLSVGNYPTAERFASASHAGLDVDLDGHGCNQSFGHFTILEVAFDASHNLLRLAADFEFHCEGSEPAIYGGVRLNSAIPYTAQAPAPYVPAFIQIVSEPGDFIGAGQNKTFTRADGLFYTQSNTALPGAQVMLQNIFGTPYEFWLLNFAPAPGQPFGPGTYENAERYPFMSPGHPGLSVAGEGRGCNTSTGRFTVYEVEYGPLNILTKFAADFEQHCGGGFPALFGAVRYNSTIPYSPPSVPRMPASISLEASDFVVPAGGTVPGPRVHLLDASSGPVWNVRVRFDLSGCGSFQGSTLVDVTTGSDGVAAPPPFVASSAAGECSVFVTVPDVAGVPPASARFHVTAPVAPPPVPVGNVQDMWWSGPQGNGWGMSIIEHGDTLFGVFFVYDEQGKPTWIVMPGGSWNSSHQTYTGSLYRPRGSVFSAYDVSRFVPGAAVGTVTIGFNDVNSAKVDYTIDGITASKLIVRQQFGPSGAAGIGPHADMWWGGSAQNGWGIAVLEQQPNIFPIWYTYDAAGNPQWFVMPVGTWTSSTTYEGRIYRTTGSPWLGHDYDPNRLHATDAGSFALRFDGDTARFEYSIDGTSGSIPLVRQPF